MHEYMQEQLDQGDDDMAAGAVPNFVWGHAWVNMHTAMMIDPLHQLLKRVVEYAVKWSMMHVREQQPSYKRKADDSDTVNLDEIMSTARIDERFHSIPAYTGLKTFNSFSTVKQWTGTE